uniref:CHK kinase-like domain-containing protein n=1 Tax=Plectus sambesii TaxID=2011161 RepID=A0A914UH00_9BILA
MHDNECTAYNWLSTKGIQSDTAADTNTLVVTQMHDNECRAYNWLSAKTSSVPHPRIYYCNGDFTNPKNPPVIIMEDLTQYQIVSLFTGFNRAQLFAITDAIATIHVRSILEPDDKWMFDLGFKDPSMETNFVNMIHAMGGMLKQIRPDMFGANVDKILESMNPSLFQEKLMSKKIFPVLAHGDLWSTNLLWDGDKLMSIIDWQIARASSVTEDLLRVLVTCVPVDVRRAMTSELLAHYYAKLTELLAVEQRQVPFSFADVERSYRETLPSTAAQTIFAAGMWINSPVVDGPDKPQRVEEVLQRTKAILDDAAVALEEQ